MFKKEQKLIYIMPYTQICNTWFGDSVITTGFFSVRESKNV